MSFTELRFVQNFLKVCKLYQSLNEDARKHKHEPNMLCVLESLCFRF